MGEEKFFITKHSCIGGVPVSVGMSQDKNVSQMGLKDTVSKEILKKAIELQRRVNTFIFLSFKEVNNNLILYRVEMDDHHIPTFLKEIKCYLNRVSKVKLEYIYEDIYSEKSMELIFSDSETNFNPNFVDFMACDKGRYYLERIDFQNDEYRLTFRSRARRVYVYFPHKLADLVLDLLKKHRSLRALRKELVSLGAKIKGKNIKRED